MEAFHCQAILRRLAACQCAVGTAKSVVQPLTRLSWIPLSHVGHWPWHKPLAAVRWQAHVEPLLCGRCRFTIKAGAPSPSRKTGFPFRFTEAAMRAA